MHEELVHNKYKKTAPAGAVYIGRPSAWGNPFAIGTQGTREEVIRKYEEWLLARPELVRKVKDELRGKHLVCFCAPAPCHGHVLARIANE